MIESAFINNRTFKINDRVKAYFEGRWITGTVDSFRPARYRYPKSMYDIAMQCGHKVEIIVPIDKNGFLTYDDYGDPVIQIRTDEKITEKENQLFDGYGVWYRDCTRSVIFEHEEEYEPFPITIIENNNENNAMP